MKTLTLEATLSNLERVQRFVEQELQFRNIPETILLQIAIAVEEIYVNIAHYAYETENGKATVCCATGGDPPQVIIQFLDEGKPFNPLKQQNPDISLPAECRKMGGLGIWMVNKLMDAVEYDYEGGKNILTIKKTADQKTLVK